VQPDDMPPTQPPAWSGAFPGLQAAQQRAAAIAEAERGSGHSSTAGGSSGSAEQQLATRACFECSALIIGTCRLPCGPM